jgi:hypothetical protein
VPPVPAVVVGPVVVVAPPVPVVALPVAVPVPVTVAVPPVPAVVVVPPLPVVVLLLPQATTASDDATEARRNVVERKGRAERFRMGVLRLP